jgi:hypothetical protein
MIAKVDAEHVIRFALVPIRGVPDRHSGIDLEGMQRQCAFDTQLPLVRDRPELVQHLERAIAAVIHRRDVFAQVVALGRIFLQVAQNFEVTIGRHIHHVFVA